MNKNQQIYSCAICLAIKNSDVDGSAYLLRVSKHPNRISKVCPLCRPNVVAIEE